MNYSRKLLNVDKCTFYTKVNACGIIATPAIERNFDNGDINIIHNIPKV